MTKEAETRWGDIVNLYGWFRLKFGDVRYTVCPHCNFRYTLPKGKKRPDFIVAPVFTYVEAKNNDARGTWKWTEIGEGGDRKLQREWMQEHGGWLFIELGTGRAPKGKGAWLIPWQRWENDIEPVLIANEQMSLRHRTYYNNDGTRRGGIFGADHLLAGYELVWETNVGWTIPKGHIWWRLLHSALTKHLADIERNYL